MNRIVRRIILILLFLVILGLCAYGIYEGFFAEKIKVSYDKKLLTNTLNEITVHGDKDYTYEFDVSDDSTAYFTERTKKGKEVTNKLVGVSTGQVALYITVFDGDLLVRSVIKDVNIEQGDKEVEPVQDASNKRVIKVKEIIPSKKSITINEGKSVQLKQTINPKNATNKSISYTSSNNKVARVTNKGLVTGLSEGKTVITIKSKDGNASASVNITIKKVPKLSETSSTNTNTTINNNSKVVHVNDISLNKNSIELSEGNSYTIIPTISPNNATDKRVNYHSDDTSIATVDNSGKITAVKAGTVNVFATSVDGSYQTSIKVTVNSSNVAVTSITATKSFKIKTGDKVNISYTVNLENATNKGVSFESSNKNVATVDASGKLTALGSGYTTITTKSKENNKIIAKTDVTVDYTYFDTCAKDKADTLKSIKTTYGNATKIYECLENQKFFNQGFAITDKYIYFVNALYGTWCKKDGTYKLDKYDLKGDCIKGEYGPTMYVSGNRIIRYTKSTGKYVYNYMDMGGHGQSFDAISGDSLYINYFSKMVYNDAYGYGGGPAGVAAVNFTGNDKEYVYPKLAMLYEKNGLITKFTSSNKFGTENYLKDVYKAGTSSSIGAWLELATDEANDSIALFDRSVSSNKNRTLYIYKLSDFKKGKMTLKSKYYIGYVCVDGTKSNCGSQGIELKGNYLYTAQETTIYDLHHESITKYNLDTCPTTDIKTKKCMTESLNIPMNTFGKDNGKMVGLSEIEGISFYKGKLYASVISNAHSNGSRYESVLLVDNF